MPKRTSTWFPRGRALVFAHRGGAGLAPENTIAAFDRGLAERADGLELDTRLSRDGVPVVIHDARLDRTTDATGPVSERTARELALVDAGARFAAAGGFPWRGQGVHVPTLREVLERYPDRPLIVELKEDRPELAAAVVADIRSTGAAARVCLASFHWRALRAARRLAPEIATSASGLEIRLSIWHARVGLPLWRPPFDAFQVPERLGDVTVASERFIRMAHRAGLPVQVWIVDSADAIRRFLGWGAHAIISDRPDVAVPAVRAFESGANRLRA